MPLAHGSSREVFERNVSEMVRAGHPRDQSLAAAYRMKRKGYAFGGPPAPWFVRNEARGMVHSGPISSIVPGRTDRHNMAVGAGSYIMPADAVSHLGQNNSRAGQHVLGKMFSSSPYGAGSPMGIKHGAGAPRPPAAKGVMARGGNADKGGARGEALGNPVEIVTAGGEYTIPPHEILNWLQRHGYPRDIKFGHKMLDQWVKSLRAEHIKTLKKLPGPAKA
jgi:hypothetical protein